MNQTRTLAAALWAALLMALPACAREAAVPGATAELFAMDTVIQLTLSGGDADGAVSAAEAELYRLEALLSRTRSDSEVSAVNDGAGQRVPVSAETAELLNAAWNYSRATGGAFDITIAPVVSAWGFTTDSSQIPTQAELDLLLEAVDYQGVLVEGISDETAAVTLLPGQSIDLGGIAKGYAADRLALLLAERNVSSAAVSLGGNVYVRGAKPDGSGWRVGVQAPEEDGGLVGILTLTDAFAVTSGGYQRYFDQDGTRYHHILDPKTGYPAHSGLTSVTIVAPCGEASSPGQGTLCDALSTALYVMGEADAADFWRTGGYPFEMALVTEDGRVLVSEGLADCFEQEAGSSYVYETIRRAAA